MIERVLRVTHGSCGLTFQIDEEDAVEETLNCPGCGGVIEVLETTASKVLTDDSENEDPDLGG